MCLCAVVRGVWVCQAHTHMIETHPSSPLKAPLLLPNNIRKGHGAVRIVHDFLLDGQPSGLSAQLFRAVVERRQQLLGREWGGVNDAWLEDGDGKGQKQTAERANIAWGHLINDPQGSVDGKANVAFQVGGVCGTSGRQVGRLCCYPHLTTNAVTTSTPKI